MRPKLLGVCTIPAPKWWSQIRLAVTRAVSGLSGFAIASARRGVAKKALVGLLIVLGLWGGWANAALAITYQRIYSWGTPFFLKTHFNKQQFAIDKEVGRLLGFEAEDSWTIGPAAPPGKP